MNTHKIILLILVYQVFSLTAGIMLANNTADNWTMVSSLLSMDISAG